ncbi:MAG: type II 3-dehydroquinate dehydratase [Chloroflexota bacterium]|nr:type II 3-dehydroquinate dehydratase [Chloroflexota bacterium]
MTYLIINGPNINALGQRDASIYGSLTLSEIESRIKQRADTLGVMVNFFQSNHEGTLIDYVQEHGANSDGIVINPGALSHSSIALRDALIDLPVPVLEVHLSNIHAREQFRRQSLTGEVAKGLISGLGWHGYVAALEYLVNNQQPRGL